MKSSSIGKATVRQILFGKLWKNDLKAYLAIAQAIVGFIIYFPDVTDQHEVTACSIAQGICSFFTDTTIRSKKLVLALENAIKTVPLKCNYHNRT